MILRGLAGNGGCRSMITDRGGTGSGGRFRTTEKVELNFMERKSSYQIFGIYSFLQLVPSESMVVVHVKSTVVPVAKVVHADEHVVVEVEVVVVVEPHE